MPLPAPVTHMAGPVFIGCFLNWFLFGALCIQLYDYHGQYQSGDRKAIKVLVYGIFMVEMVSTILITNTTWTFIIVRWGQDTAFDRCPNTSPPTIAINCLVALTVHLFFAWRIRCLRIDIYGKLASTVIIMVALGACLCGLTFTGKYKAVEQELVRILPFRPLISIWLAATFGTDALIALAMVIILTLARTDINEPSHQLKTLVNKLIVHSVETGTVTAIVASLQLILFLGFPGTFLHLTPLYVLGRLYSNVLFASLNGRHRMRSLMNATYDAGCVSSFRANLGLNPGLVSQTVSVGLPEIIAIPVGNEYDDSSVQESKDTDNKSLKSEQSESTADVVESKRHTRTV